MSRKPDGELRDEYDFSAGARGKHARSFSEGTNLIRIDEDVAEWFPDAESVNRALRSLVEIARTARDREEKTVG